MATDMDRAGEEHWSEIWQDSAIPAAIDPDDPTDLYSNRVKHRHFEESLSSFRSGGGRLLEIGAARSRWLPYFSKRYGLEVCGLDYSEVGCEQARQVLRNEGVVGEVYCSDFRSPPAELLGAFDVLVSFGVVEHFEDTSAVLESFAEYLKPGGLMITEIPHMLGFTGWLQRTVNRDIYDIHIPLSAEQLGQAHAAAGLDVEACGYFLFLKANTVNAGRWERGTFPWFWRKVLVSGFDRLNRALWVLEERFGDLPTNRLTSPYVVCRAIKPQ